MISSNFYTNDLDTPSNKRLTDGMVRDYGNIPGTYSAGLYIAGFASTRDFGPFFGFTKGCPAAAKLIVDDLLQRV